MKLVKDLPAASQPPPHSAVDAHAAAFSERRPQPESASQAPASENPGRRTTWLDAAILAALTLFIARHIPPSLLLLDTLTVGGDTPSHNYLVRCLESLLTSHGRLTGWADGWWCGFPVFQFYFCLPYLLAAALDLLLPFNVAFKLASAAGIYALPFAAYAAARVMRLAFPAPALSAIATLPFLFVGTHTMWGANAYSTLAGMIANSYGFPLMLLATAFLWRDALRGRPGIVSPLLLLLLAMSHFFTLIMTVAAAVIMPLLVPRAGRPAAFKALLGNGLLGILLSAWWLVPLMATRPYSTDFGENWAVTLASSLPRWWPACIPPVIAALWLARRGRHPQVHVVAWVLLVSTLLFRWGYSVSPVFVNVRLWPFFFHALLWLAATGVALVIRKARVPGLLTLALLFATLAGVEYGQQACASSPGRIRDWAEFNYRGLESKPLHSRFLRLLSTVSGTPGRLACDMTDANDVLGSSRIFEVAPHLVGKPIIEGGLVNSALMASFAYFVQCETSENCAGFPQDVTPSGTDWPGATRHLELLNVKHFIARTDFAKSALARLPDWHLIRRVEPWDLYELTTHEGRYVTIPDRHPLVVKTDRWKELALEWFYQPSLGTQPLLFLPSGSDPAQEPPRRADRIDENDLIGFLGAAYAARGDLCDWLELGPFPLKPPPREPRNTPPALSPEEVSQLPSEGDRDHGRRWIRRFSRCPTKPRGPASPAPHYSFHFCTIYSPEERPVTLEFTCDDALAIRLNGAPVADQTEQTGRDSPVRVASRLKQGVNTLLLRHMDFGGGSYFHLRLTSESGQPMRDIVTTAGHRPPATCSPPPLSRLQHPVWEEVTPMRIRFRTDAIGLPHLIKCSYFPNWKAVRGARAVYLASPAFMIVYPESPDVELVFSRTAADWLGLALSACGWVLMLKLIRRKS